MSMCACVNVLTSVKVGGKKTKKPTHNKTVQPEQLEKCQRDDFWDSSATCSQPGSSGICSVSMGRTWTMKHQRALSFLLLNSCLLEAVAKRIEALENKII